MMKKLLLWIWFTVVVGSMPLHAQLRYQVADGSTIQIKGTSTLSDWTVTSTQAQGEMVLQAKTAGSAVPAGTIQSVRVTVPVASIRSERGETMDNKMYAALKRDEHPEISFVLGHPLSLAGAGPVKAEGQVTIAGVTRPMTFEVTLKGKDRTMEVVGERKLKMTDFNVEPPTAMFGQIEAGDEITVMVQLAFSPQ